MKYVVTLKKFEDDSTGDTGFTHIETFNANAPFNAFWEPSGIFHDVFEHWFEDKLRYFRDKNMCNIYGEMVASGIRVWMYHNACGFDVFEYRRGNRQYTFFEDTQGQCLEAITEEYTQFPIHDIGIPYQKYIDNAYNLENVLSEYWFQFINKYPKKLLNQKEVYQSRIQNAYRYGYNLAERLYGKYDAHVLYDFFSKVLSTWNGIISSTDCPSSYFIDGSDFGWDKIQFVVSTNHSDKPMLKTRLIDDVGNQFPLDNLIQ